MYVLYTLVLMLLLLLQVLDARSPLLYYSHMLHDYVLSSASGCSSKGGGGGDGHVQEMKLRYANVNRSLLLRNRSISRSLLTFMQASGMQVMGLFCLYLGIFQHSILGRFCL
jgi:hypothetical protein